MLIPTVLIFNDVSVNFETICSMIALKHRNAPVYEIIGDEAQNLSETFM